VISRESLRAWCRPWCVKLAVVAVLVGMSGCAPTHGSVPTSSASSVYVFDVSGSMTPQPQGFLSCLGITDTQFKSVLVPGSYRVGIFSAGCSGLQVWLGDFELEFNVRGAASVGAPLVTVPVGSASYLPYAFYRFPASMGQGGAVWQPGYEGAEASSSPGASLLVWLSFGSGASGQDRSVAVVLKGAVNAASMFKTDPVSALTELVEWSVRGLAPLNPGWAPASFPATNPSPYVPPADGKLPTAPTKLPPLSSLDATASPESGGRS